MTLTFGKKLPEGLNVCINYKFNLLDHVGVVAKAQVVRQPDKINMAAVASFRSHMKMDNRSRLTDTEHLCIST